VPHAARLGAMAGWIAAARLNLIDGAFDQLAMTEQLVDVPRIVGRQAVEDLTWAAGSVGGKVAALGTISSRGESHTANRQPTSLLIADGVRNVQRKTTRGADFLPARPEGA